MSLSCLGSNWVVIRKFEWTNEDLRALPNSKDEAIAEGERYYFSGSPCMNGHLCPRHLDGHCIECSRNARRDRYRTLSAKKRGQTEWQNGRVQKMVDLDALIESGLPTSPQEAKKSGSKYYFTGNPCRNGHLSPRYMNSDCIQCNRDRTRRARTRGRLNIERRLIVS